MATRDAQIVQFYKCLHNTLLCTRFQNYTSVHDYDGVIRFVLTCCILGVCVHFIFVLPFSGVIKNANNNCCNH